MTPLDFSSYPYSHSLVALLVWASIFASLYMALSHSELRVAIVIVTLIFSHWVLDVLSHRPETNARCWRKRPVEHIEWLLCAL
jgi:membrane-bound metal-dependent hydrolase YbcI (DUF457 family)